MPSTDLDAYVRLKDVFCGVCRPVCMARVLLSLPYTKRMFCKQMA